MIHSSYWFVFALQPVAGNDYTRHPHVLNIYDGEGDEQNIYCAYLTGSELSKHAKVQRAGQGRAGQGRAGQGRAEQGRAGQSRGGQGRAGEGRAGQGRAGQGRAGQGRARQGRGGQGRTGEGRAGQGRAKQGMDVVARETWGTKPMMRRKLDIFMARPFTHT